MTVIIAVYNGEDYLEEAIRSVRQQTFRDWLLIVVDDGSSDRSADIAARWAATDDRITVHRQQNAGVAAARNTGLMAAQTTWVALLDHDDVFLPTKLERQMQYLSAHPDVACLSTWGYKIGSRGRVLGTYEMGPTTPEQFQRWQEENRLIVLVTASVVLDRDIALSLGGFRPEPGGTEDIDLWNRIADSYVIQTIPERLMLYRVHVSSVSSTALHLQRLNSDRIHQNIERRRKGQPEVGLEEFLQEWERRPEAQKRAERRITLSLALFRHAGGLLADRNPLGLWFVFRSACLRPGLVLRRVTNLLKSRAWS